MDFAGAGFEIKMVKNLLSIQCQPKILQLERSAPPQKKTGAITSGRSHEFLPRIITN
jgi:hypothetical protein